MSMLYCTKYKTTVKLGFKSFGHNTFLGHSDKISRVIDDKEEVVLKKCIDIS